MSILTKPKPPKKTRMTTRQYFDLGPSKEFNTLLIYGELITMPRPTPKHNRANHYLSDMVDRWVRHHQLGMVFFENDLILDEENALVYAPDLMFLATKNSDQYRDDFIYGPVDLAVEVLSPSNRPYLQQRKYADYERYGIPWYWVFDPNAENPTITEHQLIDGRYMCRADVAGDEWFEPGLFPGLVFRLPPLLKGDLKAAVKGKAKRLM